MTRGASINFHLPSHVPVTIRQSTPTATMSGRKDFLSQPAPENYVAGLGRGATGFTTRSDLGPSASGPTEEQIKDALAKRAAALGNAPPTAYGVTKKKDEEEEDQFQDAENEEGLFATGNYDRDDDEADRIYQDVDTRMSKRRKQARLVPRHTSPSSATTNIMKSHVHRCCSAIYLDSMPT